MAGENQIDKKGDPENELSLSAEHSDHEEDEDDEAVNGEDEDYEDLDRQLDQLHSCLDILEKQNDDLHARLCDLLESNRQVRQELLQKNQEKSCESKPNK